MGNWAFKPLAAPGAFCSWQGLLPIALISLLIGGIAFSTLLTLLVPPSGHRLLHRDAKLAVP